MQNIRNTFATYECAPWWLYHLIDLVYTVNNNNTLEIMWMEVVVA